MKITQYCFAIIILVGAFTSCKDPYMPKLKDNNERALVVEGFIDGANTTVITLSYVRNVSAHDTAAKKSLTGAVVFVEDNSGNKFPLFEQGQGRYAAYYYFNPNSTYRIQIATPDNERYVSDFVKMKVSPPIDDINIRTDSKGAVISVSTHDINNNTTYYRWSFDETWEFHSTYPSDFKYVRRDMKIVPRTEQVMVCWQSDQSTKILLSSSAKLDKDEITNFPIQTIPYGDFRLSVLYSTNVKQYALDSLGFNFWSLLKNNSEDLGSLFDPQPSNIRGNVHSVSDTSALVIGYIGAGYSYTRRVFFRIPWHYTQNCPEPYPVPNIPDSLDAYFGTRGDEPLYPELSTNGKDTSAWYGAFNYCVDCTLRGTNVKPSFWP